MDYAIFTQFKKELRQFLSLLAERGGEFKRKVIAVVTSVAQNIKKRKKMIIKVEEDVKDKGVEAYEVLQELYQMIDETFLVYVISLEAPRLWRPRLESYEAEYRKVLREEEVDDADEIERRVATQDHFFPHGEFRVQVNTKKVRNVLMLGVFENLQAKNAIKVVYDSWESTYRPRLKELMGEQVQGDIWGDLRLIRHSIAHRDGKGIDDLMNAKLITAFKPDQEIIFTPEIMEQIRQELENWYTKFLIKYFPQVGKW